MRAFYCQRAAPEPHLKPSAAMDAEAAVITARVQPVALHRNKRDVVGLRDVGLLQRLVRRRVPNGEANLAAHARTCDPNAFDGLSALVRADRHVDDSARNRAQPVARADRNRGPDRLWNSPASVDRG